MPIAPLLQQFIDDELARAPALIEHALGDTIQLLRESKDSGLTAAERAMQVELIEGLQRHALTYRMSFVESLQTRVAAELAREEGGSGMAPPSGLGGLTLMDESRVEIDIEISRATQLIDAIAEWELRELQTFTSTLIGQAHVSSESNPLRPTLYATALWDAGCIVHPAHAQRAALLRVAATAGAALLKKAWAAASSRLEQQGVTPGLYRTLVFSPGQAIARNASPAAAAAAGLPATPSTSIGKLLSAMPGGRDVHIGAGAALGSGAGSEFRTGRPASGERMPLILGAAFEQALVRLDDILRQLPATAVSKAEASALAQRMAADRATLAANAQPARERQVIALLSLIFDAMLVDTELHPAFVSPVARLQVSALRLALRDPSMVESTQHPMWQLLDRIGEASASYPGSSDSRGAALRTLCQRLAEELSRTTTPTAELCRKALAKLDEFLAAQLQAQLRAAEQSVGGLRDAEKQLLLAADLTQRLIEQMEPLRPSPEVRRFISIAWAQVLATAILQFGDDAPVSKGYIRLVDELLWSVRLPDHPASRQRLVTLLPGLLKRLRSGMALIALPQTEQQAILDELMTIHTAALRPGDRSANAELTAEQLVQRIRDEVLPAAKTDEPQSERLIELGSLQTVPAELMPSESLAPRGDASEQQVAALWPPLRRRLFINGRWARVQLLWRSEQGHFFLFAGEVAGQTHSITRSALDRLAAAGLLAPLESRSLSQRALDSVSRQISLAGGMLG